jgi:hypothetical protein
MTEYDVDHLINPELLKIARESRQQTRQKQAFVPGGDPSQGGGDPAAGGGAPPADPSAGGGAPPPDPSAGGGGGGGDVAALQQQIQQMQQQMMMMQQGGGAGGVGGAGGALKPKIDVNAVLLSILKVQARIADQLGVKIPASEMVATQQDLMGLANATQTGGPMPGMDPTATTGPQGGGGAAPGDPSGGAGGMPPMGGAGDIQGGIKGASARYVENGTAFNGNHTRLADNGNRAGAILSMIRNRSGA